MLEQHAKYDVNCPSIQDDIKAQFIDIQSRKQEVHDNVSITKTRPCNIQQYFTAVKMFIFR